MPYYGQLRAWIKEQQPIGRKRLDLLARVNDDSLLGFPGERCEEPKFYIRKLWLVTEHPQSKVLKWIHSHHADFYKQMSTKVNALASDLFDLGEGLEGEGHFLLDAAQDLLVNQGWGYAIWGPDNGSPSTLANTDENSRKPSWLPVGDDEEIPEENKEIIDHVRHWMAYRIQKKIKDMQTNPAPMRKPAQTRTFAHTKKKTQKLPSSLPKPGAGPSRPNPDVEPLSHDPGAEISLPVASGRLKRARKSVLKTPQKRSRTQPCRVAKRPRVNSPTSVPGDQEVPEANVEEDIIEDVAEDTMGAAMPGHDSLGRIDSIEVQVPRESEAANVTNEEMTEGSSQYALTRKTREENELAIMYDVVNDHCEEIEDANNLSSENSSGPISSVNSHRGAKELLPTPATTVSRHNSFAEKPLKDSRENYRATAMLLDISQNGVVVQATQSQIEFGHLITKILIAKPPYSCIPNLVQPRLLDLYEHSKRTKDFLLWNEELEDCGRAFDCWLSLIKQTESDDQFSANANTANVDFIRNIHTMTSCVDRLVARRRRRDLSAFRKKHLDAKDVKRLSEDLTFLFNALLQPLPFNFAAVYSGLYMYNQPLLSWFEIREKMPLWHGNYMVDE